MKTISSVCSAFLCALFLGLPLAVNHSYFNISAAKSLFFLVTGVLFCVIALTGYLVLWVRKKRPWRRITPLEIALLLFGAVCILSAAVSAYGYDVWLGQNARLQGAAVMGLYVLICCLLSGGLQEYGGKWQPVRFLAMGFVIVTLLAALHSFDIDPTGMFKNLDAKQRHLYISTVGNINFFSAYVCLCLPVFIVLSVYAEGKASRIGAALVLTAGGVAAVLSCSESFILGAGAFLAVAPWFFFRHPRKLIRFCVSALWVWVIAAVFYNIYTAWPNAIYKPASFLSLLLSGPWVCLFVIIAAFLVFWIYKRPGSLRVLRWVWLGTIVLAVLTVAALFVYANTRDAGDAYELFVFNDRWGSGRGKVYRLCVEILQEFHWKQWLIGIGPEALQNVMAQRGITYIDQAHSEYLQILLTTGALGLLCKMAVMGLTVAAVIKNGGKNPVAIALLMGLTAYWAQAAVNISQTLTAPIVYCFIGMISGVCQHSTVKIKKRGATK